jgi:hypothetical protein
MSLILSGTDGLSDVDGTAGTPAIRGTDANTGIFFPAADTIAFSEGGAESMRIDSAGVVSIKNTGSTADFVSETSTSLIVGNGSGTQAMTVYSGTASNGALYFADGNTGDATYRGGVQYLHGSDAMRFFTSAAERMRIDSSGNLLVGTTSAIAKIASVFDGNANNGCVLRTSTNANAAGFLYFQQDTNTCGSVVRVGTTSAVTYASTSDYRLKENVMPMTDGLNKVSRLKPVTYTWKQGGESAEGFIAHELAEVCPDAVVGEKDAVDADGNIKPQGVDTSFLVATLTAAIQELKATVDAQAARIAALEAAP